MAKQDEIETITINNIEYVRADSIPEAQPNGNRAIIVIDRGWIMAGDVEERDGRIYLTRVVWVFSWSQIGLDGVIKNPGSSKATLKSFENVDIPAAAEVYRIPVSDNWGL